MKYKSASMVKRHYAVGQRDFRRADLRGVELRGLRLGGADFSAANLRGVNLSGADLRDANLSGADLRDTNLSGANFFGINLRRADLNGADLSGTDLSEANLNRADLSRVNLSGANLSGANLGGVKLVEPGPRTNCHVNLRTFQRSEWDVATLAEWYRADALIDDFVRFPEDMRRAILGEQDGLSLYFNTRLTPIDRFLVDGVIFGLLGKNTDCRVVEFRAGRRRNHTPPGQPP